MLKIAILHPHVSIKWWAVKTLLNIWNILQDDWNKVVFHTLVSNRTNCFPELNGNLNIIDYSQKGFWKILSIINIIFALRKFDIVIAGNSPMHFVAVLWKIFNPKIKVYWYLQNLPVYYLKQNKSIFTSIKKYLEKLIIPFIDDIITNSSFIKEEVLKDFKRESLILYPSVDTDFFSNDHSALEENSTLFCYSRLSKWKNVWLAIDTFITLQKDFPWLKLLIWWIWEEEEMLKEKAKFYTNIEFLGELDHDEVRLYLERCTIFLFTSKIDAFWLTILEAMSMEKCVVALAIWWALELIWNWENWYLAKDDNEFIWYVSTLLNNPDKRQMMWSKWREWALEHFSDSKIKEEILNIFHK